MISRDPYNHILKVSGQYHYFWLSYKGLLQFGDYDHEWSWLGEVRLSQVRLGCINYLKGPLQSCPESCRLIT